MNTILEEYRKRLNNDSLTEEQAMQQYNQDKEEFDSEVRKKANEYDSLGMDSFIRHIGTEKINKMNQINEKLNRSVLINGKLVEKNSCQSNREDIEEWKKGFMDGFEEAYKRIYGKQNT